LISQAHAAEQLRSVGTFAIVEDDFVYARAGDTELRAHTYRPKHDATLPAIIDVHGGAWSSGDRMSGALYDRALATAGLLHRLARAEVALMGAQEPCPSDSLRVLIPIRRI
jgi:acetyl esterase/lipase